MNNKITIMSEQFENEESSEKVEGITIIVDGALKHFMDIVIADSPKYSNSLEVVQDALFKGLEIIKEEVSKKSQKEEEK